MVSLALLLALQTSSTPTKWYGPETVTFNVSFAGNPYDIEKSDMRVRFIDAKGNKTERLAFYDDEEAGWKAVFLAEAPGKYKAVLLRNGKEMETLSEPELVDVGNKSEPLGFVRRDPLNKLRFRYDDGTPYMPIGYNLGWQNGNMPDLTETLKKMGQNGINWSRIWACNWDGKNPWWPNVGQADGDRMASDAFRRWDQLVTAAEDAGIALQVVLFNHGSFSTRVNPNWQDHPWNKTKGGFLDKASDFFTDPEAKRRAKMWLRYAVARWGHSPAVMAWELFNEVEWVDSRYEGKWADVLAWHQEMAEYVRSIDPYRHLVATSSTFEQPNLYDAVDYYQPHTYPSDVRTAISSWKQPGDKPAFFGEFGPGVLGKKGQRLDVRDGIWAGLLSGQAGAGSFWSWDIVHSEDLYGEWKIASKVLNESGLKDRPGARPLSVKISTAGTSDLVFNPGIGWGNATKTRFSLQAGSKPDGLGELSSFLQGTGHREMFPEPLTFVFRAPKAGRFTMHLGQVSKGGGNVKVTLNGKVVGTTAFPGGPADAPAKPNLLSVDYPAGTNEIQIENVGPDWVTMVSYSFSGMDFEASAQAIGQVDWLMVRITANGDTTPEQVTLSALGLAPGSYERTVTDLGNGQSTKSETKVESVGHAEKVPLPGRDVMVVFQAKR